MGQQLDVLLVHELQGGLGDMRLFPQLKSSLCSGGVHEGGLKGGAHVRHGELGQEADQVY